MLPPSIEPWIANPTAPDSLGTTLSRLAFENAFVQLWTRPALSLRDRSLVTISMLVAQGSEKELALHVASGLRNGLTPEEIEEVVYQATAYASFPRASQAAGVVGRVLAQERQQQSGQ
jgi:4-carboxymuconolactone decarboxylase